MRHSGSMKLFLGLVTHAGSRFNGDGSATYQLENIGSVLRSMGHDVESLVSDRDDFNADTYSLGMCARVASAWSQSELEYRWNKHIAEMESGASPGLQLGRVGLRLGSGIRRVLSALEVPGLPHDTSRAGLARLINIDLSHIRLWKAAREFDADLALVLEDDARLDGPDSVHDVAQILECLPREEKMLAVLSSSLAPSRLRLQRLIGRAHPLNDPCSQVSVMPSAVTNTVCANAYSMPLLDDLVTSITPDSLYPVHPIDWRVNGFLLENPGVVGLWTQPAPFVQMSMR